MQRGRQVRNIQTLPILAIEVDCKRKKSDPRRCARHNGRVRENPGRQQAYWGFLIRCTNLTQPTGALDSKNSLAVVQLLLDVRDQIGCPVVTITHNAEMAKVADRVFYMKDGQIQRVEENTHPLKAEELQW